ncbi:hypothetical protein BKA66DRAFT_577841 [Pyrenochaeta sp. MPI-SDFR-AT-0127]|nr:hypothetical protein BKA66DRAFT_577841 [Pyrenochaeta sp. MPI-SDFR-AT-0127]
MSETRNERSVPLIAERLPVILLHVGQLLHAVIILGLVAYGVRYIESNILIYSLIIAVLTIIVCTYLIASPFIFVNPHVFYIALHALMLVFWTTGLGLLSYLARIWYQPTCMYQLRREYQCATFEKRDLGTVLGRESASYIHFSRALVASAALAAGEVTLWIATACFMVYHFFKRTLALSLQGDITSSHIGHRTFSLARSRPDLAVTFYDPWDTTETPATPRATAQPVLPSPEDDHPSFLRDSLATEPSNIPTPFRVPQNTPNLERSNLTHI